jgi:AcrR family transcriptional regulator
MKKQKVQKDKVQVRSVATRKRVLEATVRSLVECGYAGTTTYEVCRRAKAARGTLLHHFPTRQELVVQAVEYVLVQSLENFQKTVTEYSTGNPPLADLARALWEKHWTSDTFYAWLELVVASRTDVELNRKVKSMEKRWLEKMSLAFQNIVSYELTGPFALFFCSLSGLSIAKIYSDPKRLNEALEGLFASVDFFDRFFLLHGVNHK